MIESGCGTRSSPSSFQQARPTTTDADLHLIDAAVQTREGGPVDYYRSPWKERWLNALVVKVAVSEVPTEIVKKQIAEYRSAVSVTAQQKEGELTKDFEEYLIRHRRCVMRYRIELPSGSAIYSDLTDVTAKVLYEAKGATSRMSVRLAIGQVLDYGRYVPCCALAVLLPERPDNDMVDLLANLQIGCVVRSAGGRFTDMTKFGRCP